MALVEETRTDRRPSPTGNGRIRLFIAVLVVFGIVAGWLLRDPLPTVYESWSRKECVKVVPNYGRYGCDNLPPKYNHQWLE